jgi:hypothetical protein
MGRQFAAGVRNSGSLVGNFGATQENLFQLKATLVEWYATSVQR